MSDKPESLSIDDEARWNAVAADYERWAEPLTVQYARAALTLAGVVSGERVLDVAAGTGALSLAAAVAGAHVLATDSSPAMVARLRDRLRPFTGSEARVMNGQALEVGDGAFDAAFSVFGVMLFPEWRRGLMELVRATRRGGRVVVATWVNPEGAGPMPAFLQAYRQAFPDAEVPPAPPGMSVLCAPDLLKAETIAAGCDEVSVHKVDGAWTGPSVERVIAELDLILRLAPLYTALDAADRDSLRGPLRAVMETYAEPDGTVRIPATANIAVGHVPT